MTAPLRLFNSLTRELEAFLPVHAHEARVHTCVPTVYNYPHIGNTRPTLPYHTPYDKV